MGFWKLTLLVHEESLLAGHWMGPYKWMDVRNGFTTNDATSCNGELGLFMA